MKIWTKLERNVKQALKLPSPYRKVASVTVNVTKPDTNSPYALAERQRLVEATVERWSSPTPGTVEVFALSDIDGVREINQAEYARLVTSTL